MGSLSLQGLSKAYSPGHNTVHGVDLEIGDGEFVVFVGPSGCGKSTLLRMVAGLESITSGMLTIDGVPMNDVSPSARGVAMVFQSYALYPHLSVAENLGFPLTFSRMSRGEIAKRVGEVAEILQLTPFLDRKPSGLSGGQRQRVAIGRAIVREPKVFLFDEPLSNLDAALRNQMRVELSKLHRRLGTTMVYVTHDQVEAMTLGERIVVFNAGRIEQVGTPVDLYGKPANLFVAGFLGTPRMNFISGETAFADDGQVQFRSSALSAPIHVGGTVAAGPVTMGLRAQDIVLTEPSGAVATGRIELVEHLGETALAHVNLDSGGQSLIARIADPGDIPPVGLTVGVSPMLSRAHWFDAHGRRIEVRDRAA